jgi:pyridoxine 4-dehydrogenase
MQRCGVERLALAQLHWSTANYAPLQERLMWDGLVAIYEEVGYWPAGTAASRGGQGDR